MIRPLRLAGVWAALLGLLAPLQGLSAQETGSFKVTPRVGYMAWSSGAALQDPLLSSGDCEAPSLGVECEGLGNNFSFGLSALYQWRPSLAVGLSFDVTRPVAAGTYFPQAQLNFSGRGSTLTVVNQRLTVALYGIEAEYQPELGEGRLSPFLVGSLGGYTVYLDPELTNGAERISDLAFTLGGGVDIAMGETTGFRVQLRDYIFTGWERDRLNPVEPGDANAIFPDVLPIPPDECTTCHNFQLSVGFRFTPGGGR